MSNLRKKFTENAEQFDALMVEMLAENERLKRAIESTWRCYHCNEVFNDSEAARKHFGNIPSAIPLCILQKCLCLDCSCNPTECAGRR